MLNHTHIAPSQQLDCDVSVKQPGRHKPAGFSTTGWAGRSSSGRLPISSANNSAGHPCRTASSTRRAGTAACRGASPHPVCERSWMIRATLSTCSGRSLLSSVMTSYTDAILLPCATKCRKSTRWWSRIGMYLAALQPPVPLQHSWPRDGCRQRRRAQKRAEGQLVS